MDVDKPRIQSTHNITIHISITISIIIIILTITQLPFPPPMLKFLLQHTNRNLLRYNHSDAPSLWTFWHTWNYQHTLVKNVLQFSNQVLKQANKYHVFRWDWMVGLVGAMTGFVVMQLEEIYYQVRIGYKPTTSCLVDRVVLKNQAVSGLIKYALNTNVFYSPDMQFYVHQALLNQVLTPQKDQIKWLINQSLTSLSEPNNLEYLSGQLSEFVPILNKPISNAALPFLDSEVMDGIVANGLASILRSLFFKDFLASQINYLIKNFLNDPANGEYLYKLVKDKFNV